MFYGTNGVTNGILHVTKCRQTGRQTHSGVKRLILEKKDQKGRQDMQPCRQMQAADNYRYAANAYKMQADAGCMPALSEEQQAVT